MFTPIPPRFESDEEPARPLESRRVPGRRGSRLRLVNGLGACAVALGAFLRISALSLASNSTPRPGAVVPDRSTDPHLYALFSETGTWFIAFGALVGALCLVEWARRDSAA